MILDSDKIKQRIGFSPHAKQQEILSQLKRFNVIAGGKRVGKTILVAYLALKELLASDRSIWIVAPTYDLSKRSWEYLDFWAKRFFPDILKSYQAPEPKMESATGSLLELKSAENEKSLLGKGLDLLILDEAARTGQDIWERYLTPNLMDRTGRALLIGNPWGKNWFYDQFLMPNNDSSYFSYHMPTAIEVNGRVVGSNNPGVITVEELQRIKDHSPENVWKQEYLAEFMEGAGQVFRKIEGCIGGILQSPIRGYNYLMGVDLGRLVDFTVIVVVDRATRRVVHFDRFNKIDWVLQKARIAETARKYNDAIIHIDSTGLGDPVTEELKMQSLVIEDYKYSRASKRKLIDKLAMLIEQKKILFPKIDVLVDELEAFSFEETKSGNLQYFAPSNKHDDCVNALALAVWGLMDDEGNSEQPVVYYPIHTIYS